MTPYERSVSRAAWKEAWRAAHPDEARERNRRDQVTWRAKNAATVRANNAERYAWIRARRLATGWVPLTKSACGRLGAEALKRHRA